jgi:TRAP-type C4-dicarboxylate transport system permease small subunit
MFEKILKGLRAVLYWFSFTAMLVMLALIFVQVITRYCFGYTPEWSEELARFLFVWVVFLGSALIMGEGGHLAVQFVPLHYKGKPFGKVLEIIINLSSYAFTILLLVQGAKMTKTMTFQLSPGMDLPMSYVYFVIPLSCALMLLYIVRDTIQIIRDLGKSTSQRPPASASEG